VSERPGGLTGRTISGVLWTAWGKGGHTVLNLLALVILARLLSPREFGTVGAALVLIEFSSIFSRLGLGPAVVQRRELESRHLKVAFTGSLILGLAIGLLVWLLAGQAAGFFRNAQVADVLRALAWVFPLKGVSALAEALLLRDLRFRWLANLDVATFAFGQVCVAIPLAYLGFGVWSLVVGTMAQTLIRCGLLLLVRRPPGLGLERQALGEMLHFGAGFTIARLANLLALQGDNLVVGRWLGPAALGLYSRAYGLMSAPASALGNVLDDVLFPTMARVQDDPVRLGLAYRRGVALIALVALPASVGMVILAPELVGVALGDRWVAATAPFQVLAAGTLFRTSYKMSDSLARSTGVVYSRARRQILYAAMVIGGAMVGQRWGITGVALGVLVALVANFLSMAQLSLTVCRMSWSSFWQAHRASILLAGAFGSSAWLAAAAARTLQAPPLAVILMALTSGCAIGVWLIRRYPATVLGADGVWALSTITGYVRRGRGRGRRAAEASNAAPMPLS
jgi:O-antigen/teichoic acid export membrane protein